MHTNTRIEFFFIVYSPSLTRDQGEIHVTTLDCTQRRKTTRRWEASFKSLFTGRISYLLGLSGPQLLDSYRLETQSRLGVNQALSLTQTVSVRVSQLTTLELNLSVTNPYIDLVCYESTHSPLSLPEVRVQRAYERPLFSVSPGLCGAREFFSFPRVFAKTRLRHNRKKAPELDKRRNTKKFNTNMGQLD